MSELPKKYIIPEDRLPQAWSQGVYNCCVAASVTKVLEVINYIKTGKYTMFSKGYTYGRHSRPDKTQGGMDYGYIIPRLLERGTVPEEMYPELDEIPSIIEKIAALPNIAELDREAEKTRVKSFTKIKGDIYFYDNVKKCLYEYNMPLVGNMVGKRHSTVIVGWDGESLLYHDHKGKSDIVRGKFNEAYYLDGGIGMEFKDVNKSDWFYNDVKYVFENGYMNGVSEEEFKPNEPLTRAEAAALIHRTMEGGK